MKICVAQTRPVKGDVAANISTHKKLIALAVSSSADIIVFPELSLTGYEPALAKDLAADIADKRFDDFQEISDLSNISIGVGMPVKNNAAVLIGIITFQSHRPREVYPKQYLHQDEIPFFVNGHHQIYLPENKTKIAPAICYEVFVPEHVENAFKNDAKIYLASVAKSYGGAEKAMKTMSCLAKKYAMTVLMSNCIGHCDNFDCGGKTSIWNDKGQLLGQLDDQHEGILIIDTDSQEIIQKVIL